MIQDLLSLEKARGIQLGLESIKNLHQEMGSPGNSLKIIHIAGTNGKGSVATKIAHSLQKNGLKVGLYTSPHLFSLNERFQINGKTITDADLEEQAQQVLKIDGGYTFFDATTAIAWNWFAKNKVDYAVIETGMGGRLDSTNLLTPILSIITSISLDHCSVLGHTIEVITKEKAGIIKPGIPVVIGPTVPISVIRQFTQQIEVVEARVSPQEENEAIAKRALQLLNYQPIELDVLPPFRSEWIGEDLIVDVAHNPAGLEALFQTIRKKTDKDIEVLTAFSHEKETQACLEVLSRYAKKVTLITHSNPNLIPAEKLSIDGLPFKRAALEEALKNSSPDRIKAICGSFHLIAEVVKAIAKIKNCR